MSPGWRAADCASGRVLASPAGKLECARRLPRPGEDAPHPAASAAVTIETVAPNVTNICFGLAVTVLRPRSARVAGDFRREVR